MATFVDTSALFALLSLRDPDHEAASRALGELKGQSDLVTHNYVVVEATALVQRRLGKDAVRDLHERLLPPLTTVWIDESTHRAAVSALLTAGRWTFVDVVSFEVMRRLRIETAFAFDRDFVGQGFATIP